MSEHLTDERAKFLLVKGRAGLGNRMLATATGILYARLTGRRVVVDWSDETYSDDRSNAFPRFFECPSHSPADQLPATDSIAPALWRGRLRASVIELEAEGGHDPHAGPWRNPRRAEFVLASSIDPRRLDYEEELVVMWSTGQQVEAMRAAHQAVMREFPRGSTTRILRELLREELVLQPPIRERVTRFAREHFRGRVVGVHVRYTDQRVRLEEILMRLDRLVSREPDLLVFLATDNAEIKELLDGRYRAVLTTPHWYPPSGLPIHRSPDCPNRFESGIEALVDLYLLAECDHLICDGSSSFARVAKLLTRAPYRQVIDVRPRPWHRRFSSFRTRARLRLRELRRGPLTPR